METDPEGEGPCPTQEQTTPAKEPDIDNLDIDVEKILSRTRPLGIIRKRFYEAPEFTKRLEPYIEVQAGGSIELVCEFKSLPRPGVTWFKDEIELSANDNIQFKEEGQRLVLSIKVAQKWDEGTYRCRLMNEEGSTSSTGYLQVKGENMRPLDYQPRKNADHAVSQPPHLRSIKEQYSLEEKDEEGSVHAYIDKRRSQPEINLLEEKEESADDSPVPVLQGIPSEEDMAAPDATNTATARPEEDVNQPAEIQSREEGTINQDINENVERDILQTETEEAIQRAEQEIPWDETPLFITEENEVQKEGNPKGTEEYDNVREIPENPQPQQKKENPKEMMQAENPREMVQPQNPTEIQQQGNPTERPGQETAQETPEATHEQETQKETEEQEVPRETQVKETPHDVQAQETQQNPHDRETPQVTQVKEADPETQEQETPQEAQVQETQPEPEAQQKPCEQETPHVAQVQEAQPETQVQETPQDAQLQEIIPATHEQEAPQETMPQEIPIETHEQKEQQYITDSETSSEILEEEVLLEITESDTEDIDEGIDEADEQSQPHTQPEVVTTETAGELSLTEEQAYEPEETPVAIAEEQGVAEAQKQTESEPEEPPAIAADSIETEDLIPAEIVKEPEVREEPPAIAPENVETEDLISAEVVKEQEVPPETEEEVIDELQQTEVQAEEQREIETQVNDVEESNNDYNMLGEITEKELEAEVLPSGDLDPRDYASALFDQYTMPVAAPPGVSDLNNTAQDTAQAMKGYLETEIIMPDVQRPEETIPSSMAEVPLDARKLEALVTEAVETKHKEQSKDAFREPSKVAPQVASHVTAYSTVSDKKSDITQKTSSRISETALLFFCAVIMIAVTSALLLDIDAGMFVVSVSIASILSFITWDIIGKLG